MLRRPKHSTIEVVAPKEEEVLKYLCINFYYTYSTLDITTIQYL
jgi:hypothetical protein